MFGLFLFVLLLKTNFFSLEPQRIALVEKEIPLFVEVFTTSTDDFLLKLDSARNGFGELSKEIDLVCVNLTKGFSFPQTMQAFRQRNNSSALVSFSKALEDYYETNDSANLIVLGEGVFSKKLNAIRSFSSKSSLVGIVFISLSVVIPSLCAAYLAVGSSFLDLSFTGNQVLVLFSITFPAVNLIVSGLLMEKIPVF
ncbi:hypothetical protein HUU53_00545 [Candidatus Micrarchaeota archaeon]|nr:hypothetical protein [Candidatus Micrarchaeota archaeon]